MGRNTSDVEVFDPSEGYKDFVVAFFNGGPINGYKLNPVTYEYGPQEGLSQLKNESNFNEEEIRLALALSLSLKE